MFVRGERWMEVEGEECEKQRWMPCGEGVEAEREPRELK